MDFFDTLIAQLQKEAVQMDSFAVDPRDWQVFLDPAAAQRIEVQQDVPVEQSVIETVENKPVSSVDVFDIEALRADIAGCRECPLAKMRKNPALSYGNPHAKLMIVIENPSLLDDEDGQIFAGEVGALLDKMLLAMGLKRSDTYITAIVKCRTPGNRQVSEDELNACRKLFFDREIKAVKPECILAFGAGFAKNILHREGTISNLRGTFDSYDGIPVMSTFNPAYLLRQPSAKRTVWNDLQMVMKALNLNG